MRLKKTAKIIICIVCTLVVVAAVLVPTLIWYIVGFPECVGAKKYSYTIQELHVEADGIDHYGKLLTPDGESGEKYPTVIYAHGAESDYKADMSTLKSLAMSGIAVYTFDFYGWTNRTKGEKKGAWFKGTARGVDNAYEAKVLEQVDELNAVIEKIKTLDCVDTNNIFLLGSSMGGATVATCAVTHSDDIRGIILQYPAINLNPDATVDGATYDVNKYTRNVLLLQGTTDVIVPISMSENLYAHYNKYTEHCTMRIYCGEPHVFHGKYKIVAARAVYDFIQDELFH